MSSIQFYRCLDFRRYSNKRYSFGNEYSNILDVVPISLYEQFVLVLGYIDTIFIQHAADSLTLRYSESMLCGNGNPIRENTSRRRECREIKGSFHVPIRFVCSKRSEHRINKIRRIIPIARTSENLLRKCMILWISHGN